MAWRTRLITPQERLDKRMERESLLKGARRRAIQPASILIFALILLASVGLIDSASAQPSIPLQIFGAASTSGTPLPDGNTVIVTAEGKVIARGLVANGAYGYEPVYFVPAKSESKPGGTEGQPITIYVNGFSTATPAYKTGGVTQTDLATTSPVCGAGTCQEGENCLHCAAKCACTDLNIANVPLKDAFISGTPQGITNPVILVSTEAGGAHRVKIQKEAGKTLVEIVTDLKANPLDLGKLTIRESTRGNLKSITSSGLEGGKVLFLEKSGGTDTICAKDHADATAEAITETCTGTGEVKVKCDGQAVQGITCQDKQTQFAISGLTHSAVIETAAAPPSPIDISGLPPAPLGPGEEQPQNPQPQSPQSPEPSPAAAAPPAPTQAVNIENYDATKYREEYRKAWQESRKGKEPAPAPPAAPKTCTEDWICNTWSDCNPQGTQVRGCTDKNKCGTTKGQPPTSQPCSYIPAPGGGSGATPPPAPQPIATPLVAPTPSQAMPAPITPVTQRPAAIPAAAPTAAAKPEGPSTGFWIWIIGILIIVIVASSLEIWHLVSQQRKQGAAEDQQLLASAPYVTEYQKQGYTEFDIRKMFKSQGWDDQQLDRLFALVQRQKNS